MEPPTPQRSDTAIAWVAGAGVFSVTAGIGTALAAPAPHWLDASEFAAASFVLGNAHPPGHPLEVALGKLATLFPFGGIAFRVNLASAVALGVAAVLVLFTLRRLLLEVVRAFDPEGPPPSRVAVWPVAVAGALGLSLAPPALLQGVRAEVYALNLALNLGLVLLALRHLETGSGRDLALAGLIAGLGLGNHHLLTLATAPAVLAAALWRRRDTWRRVGRRLAVATLAGLLGAMILAQLPARSRTAPPVNWGAPHTLDRFAWTVSARLFQRTARRSVRAHPATSGARLLEFLASELGLGIGLAALVGLLLLGLRRRLLGPLVVLGLAASANLAAAVLAGFDPHNPDSAGYVLLGLSCAAALAGAALGAGIHRLEGAGRPRWVPVALAVGVTLWPLQSLAGAVGRVDLRQAYGAEVAGQTLLDAVPEGGLALTSYYQTGFALWAAQLLSGARPDVDHVHRSFLGQPGYVENRLARTPALAKLLAGVTRPGALDARRLRAESRLRAVRLEFDDDTVGLALVRASLDRGGWLEVLAPGDPRADRPQPADWVAWQLRPLQRLLRPHLDDPMTRMWLLWVSYLDARYHRLRGECGAARLGWSEARRLGNPGDPMLARLARACGFVSPQGSRARTTHEPRRPRPGTGRNPPGRP